MVRQAWWNSTRLPVLFHSLMLQIFTIGFLTSDGAAGLWMRQCGRFRNASSDAKSSQLNLHCTLLPRIQAVNGSVMKSSISKIRFESSVAERLLEDLSFTESAPDKLPINFCLFFKGAGCKRKWHNGVRKDSLCVQSTDTFLQRWNQHEMKRKTEQKRNRE